VIARSKPPRRKRPGGPRRGRLQGKDIQAQRLRIFERDQGICQDCGIRVLFNAPEEWGNSFHRAHIRGKRMFGDDDSNLKTSCGNCHRAHHNSYKPCPPKPRKE
jgi:5-methylcytosine-specific restriction endonuclease McrA